MNITKSIFSHRAFSLYGGHDDEINCLVFSRDFEILLTASINGFIRLWNTVCNHLTFKIQEKTGMLINKRMFK
jgi:WD40 repeat protein